jgi:hypothetical protein
MRMSRVTEPTQHAREYCEYAIGPAPAATRHQWLGSQQPPHPPVAMGGWVLVRAIPSARHVAPRSPSPYERTSIRSALTSKKSDPTGTRSRLHATTYLRACVRACVCACVCVRARVLTYAPRSMEHASASHTSDSCSLYRCAASGRSARARPACATLLSDACLL